MWVVPVLFTYQFCAAAGGACTSLPSMLATWPYMLRFFFTPLAAMSGALVLWWRRSRVFPVYWSLLVVALPLLAIGVAWFNGEGPLKDFTPRDLVGAIIVPAYWLRSRRVKATFTRKWRREGVAGIPSPAAIK